jgi:hypothetical protein
MLHETTRKWICRRAFVACCLIPTLLVVGAVGYYHRPWRMAAIGQQLSASLRAKVSLGQAWQSRPGVMQYRSIQVRDARTDWLMLAADCLQVDRHSGAHTYRFDQVELPQAGLASLLRLLETQLATSEYGEIHFQIDQATIHRGQASDVLNLKNLHFHGKRDSDRQAQAAFQLRAQAEYQAEDQVLPLGLTLKCRSLEDSHHLEIELDLKSAALPGWILQGLIVGGPIFQDAQFQGVILWETDLQHTQGQLRGRHTNLQLQHLLSQSSQHQWSGQAMIHWDQLRWRDGRMVEAEGLLWSSHGSASRSLVADATKLLYCQTTVELGSAPNIAFDELACRFQMGAKGLILWGECQLETAVAVGQKLAQPQNLAQPPISRCLLAMQGVPLLWQSKYIVPVAQLVRLATTPTHNWTLPATREAQRLAQVLPLPEVEKK